MLFNIGKNIILRSHCSYTPIAQSITHHAELPIPPRGHNSIRPTNRLASAFMGPFVDLMTQQFPMNNRASHARYKSWIASHIRLSNPTICGFYVCHNHNSGSFTCKSTSFGRSSAISDNVPPPPLKTDLTVSCRTLEFASSKVNVQRSFNIDKTNFK